MCRYTAFRGDHKTHWACLPCRYTAKHPKADGGPACPYCRAPMVDLGRDFRAPRRADVRQWRKVALLVGAGLAFDSCGCAGPGARPRTLADARSQLGPRRKGSAPRRTRRAVSGEFL